MEREREGHWHRGTAGATAWKLEVQGRWGNGSLWINGGFLVGLELLQFAGGWKGKSGPHGACLLELVSENKSDTGPLLQNQRTQEIIFKKEVQPLS